MLMFKNSLHRTTMNNVSFAECRERSRVASFPVGLGTRLPLLCNVPVPSPEVQPSLCTANTSYASPVQQLPQFQRWGLSWNYSAILQNMELVARCPPTPQSGYLNSISSFLTQTPGLVTFSDHSFFLSPVDLYLPPIVCTLQKQLNLPQWHLGPFCCLSLPTLSPEHTHAHIPLCSAAPPAMLLHLPSDPL